MYSLIMKDILIQKKSLLFSMFYILFLAVVLQSLKDGIYAATVICFCYMMLATACAYDDKNKADLMLNSLPIKRSTIVMAKYVSTLVFFAISTVAYLVIMTLVNLAGLSWKLYPITIPGLCGAVFAISLLNSIYLPCYFKLGYIRSRIVNFVLFFGVFAGITGLVSIAKETQRLPNMINYVSNFSDVQIAIMIIIFAIAILTISYALSLRAYISREF